MTWAGPCFCFCSLQLTRYRSILFIFAHVSRALDIMTYFPFCFCSGSSWMTHIFHAFRAWSDVRETCGHWIRSLASWEYTGACFPGVLDLCWEAALACQQVENSGSQAWRWASPAVCGPVCLCPSVCAHEPTSLLNENEGDDISTLSVYITHLSRHLSLNS